MELALIFMLITVLGGAGWVLHRFDKSGTRREDILLGELREMRMASEKFARESNAVLEGLARDAFSAANPPVVKAPDEPAEEIPHGDGQEYQTWVREDDHEWSDMVFPGPREDVAVIAPGSGIPGIGTYSAGLPERNLAGEEYDG